jgi:hypothetical protein
MEGKEHLVTEEWLRRPRLLSEVTFLVKIADLGFSKI